MTITDKQIEAAAEVLHDALRAPHHARWHELHEKDAKRRIYRRAARAALEAGEAAAWSRDLSAAPPSAPLLIFMGSSLDTGMVLENPSTGERTWWSGDFRVNPEDIWMWRHVPKPRTEEGK